MPYLTGAETSREPVWMDPHEFPPPPQKKVQLLTKEGVAIFGIWSWELGCIAWAPCLKIPPHIKEKMR